MSNYLYHPLPLHPTSGSELSDFRFSGEWTMDKENQSISGEKNLTKLYHKIKIVPKLFHKLVKSNAKENGQKRPVKWSQSRMANNIAKLLLKSFM